MALEGSFPYRKPPDSHSSGEGLHTVSKLEQSLEKKEGNKDVKTYFA